jgi:tRNA-specific 2-thiouridylase
MQGATGRYGGPMIDVVGDSSRDGEWALVRLTVDDDRIAAADAPGIERDLAGLTLLEAAAVGGEELAVDALAAALGQVFRAAPDPDRVAVAMSGGVDSAVALLRAGPQAVGVTLRLWLDPDGPDSTRACCSPEAVLAARRTCHERGLPHVTLDAREDFRRAIVTPFVRGYGRGETPNPGTRCNGRFRFAELLRFARRAGAARLATGHYARIVERDGQLLVARAADETKDQSYMLATVDPAVLGRLWFPLGEQTKEETRGEAQRAGLEAARRADSQEACFLAGADYRDFLGRSGLTAEPGAIVDETGRELGRHNGFWRFTPGQRKGLGVAAAQPLYVIRTDARRNAVVAGPLDALATTGLTASGRLYAPATAVHAKLRARSPLVPARVKAADRGFELELDEPVNGVARGQTAVLYDGDAVIGAGTIRTVSHDVRGESARSRAHG